MLTTRLFALASLLPSLLMLGSACDVSEIGDDLGAIELRPFGCSACGNGFGNSPVVNGNTLQSFSLDGTFNEDGVRFIGAEFPGKPRFDISVDPVTEQWIVTEPGTGTVKYSGAELLGARLVLESADEEVSLEIVEVDTAVPSWSDSGEVVTAYRAVYKGPQGQMLSVCPSLALDEQWFVLIAGETYHQDAQLVQSRPSWVTLACAGQAAAKMKLLGYHAASSTQPDIDARKATLRMITADYCGTGQSFTVAGTHVAWRDRALTVQPQFDEISIEAMWGPNGAICLTHPRHVERVQVEDACDIPLCAGEDFGEKAIWRTMLPQ